MSNARPKTNVNKVPRWVFRYVGRVAKSAGTGEPRSSIAKDLIDSEDPKHTLFCRETAFVAIYALFQG